MRDLQPSNPTLRNLLRQQSSWAGAHRSLRPQGYLLHHHHRPLGSGGHTTPPSTGPTSRPPLFSRPLSTELSSGAKLSVFSPAPLTAPFTLLLQQEPGSPRHLGPSPGPRPGREAAVLPSSQLPAPAAAATPSRRLSLLPHLRSRQGCSCRSSEDASDRTASP